MNTTVQEDDERWGVGEGQAEILPECKIYNNIFYSYSKEIYSMFKKKSLKSRVEFSLFP